MKQLRQPTGGRYPDLNDLRRLLADDRVWCFRGEVWKPPDADSHYRIVDQGAAVLVEVRTKPSKADLTCQLGVPAAGAGQGLWSIPPVGTEVIVSLPDGLVDFHPTIICIIASPSSPAPAHVADGKTILVATGVVEITAPKIVISSNPDNVVESTDGFVHGRGIDAFTGAPYYALGNASKVVLGEK